MDQFRVSAALTIAALKISEKARRVLASGDRGSETIEKVLWTALTVAVILSVYAIFRSKVVAKITGVEL
jgi:hypothetical protein